MREFLSLLPDLVRQQLPAELADFQVRGPTVSLVKLHYGNPSIHYEAWIQRRKGELELGLHFEGNPASDSTYLEFFRQHSKRIDAALGQGVGMEWWGVSWTRVHQAIPLEPLTDDFLVEVSVKLSRMIQTLEPLLRSLP
ncbi:MAG: hypothetical protein V1724_10240 [Chloroflexota bacterium]